MPPLPAHLRRPLTVRFQTALAALVGTAAPRIARAWAALPDYDEQRIPTFARATESTFNAAKLGAIAHAGGYYAISAGVQPVGVNPNLIDVAPDVRAPFIAVWNALDSKLPIADAISAGSARTEAVVANLVQSAARRTGDEVHKQAGVRVHGWERIPDGDACPWCLDVAPGFYHSAESADFGHDRCGCTAAPIYSN